MADVTDLAAKRWETKTQANDHDPAAALEAAMRDLASGDLRAEHIVIIAGRHDPEGHGTRVYQAGSYSFPARVGLLAIGQRIMEE